MGSHREWRRVEELFFRCEELDLEERRAFLDQACAADVELRQRVERLLAAAGSAGDRLEQIVYRAALSDRGAEAVGKEPESDGREGAADAGATTGAAPPVAGGDDRLGPYRLLEVLGEGGMGTVYLAERADGLYHQRVAVKVVRQGLSGSLISRRFERERQILARVEHPAVARLLDGGTNPAGQPYLVMEYVDGKPIDAYCDARRLTVSQRLELFRKVCDGVRAAHRNLIVHRDLKPSNILVTAEGRPKLLDFGISKLLEGDGASEGTALTLLGLRMLTPEYASPEQVRDEPITTAVDVYALGLLLHRLLTGDRPYPLPPTRGAELRKAICDVPAERPSTTVTRLASDAPERLEAIARARETVPPRLRRRLAGDLDHIVSKALRKEPDERYESVELLSADIGRHLEGSPVAARRGGWRYLGGRFLRRNRVAVTAAAAVVLALALGLLAQTREARRANREAARANREARDSAEVAGFLVNLFDASDPYRTGHDLTARQLLDRGVARIQEELTGQPLTQAHLMSTLGRVYHNRGLFPEAEPLFAGALERREQNLPAGHADIATSHLDLADDLRVLGRYDEATPHYEQVVAMRRKLFGDDSLELAQALNNMALNLMQLAEYPRARELLERAMEIRRRKLGEHELVAQSLHNLTLIASRQGDYRTAVARGRETLALKAKVLRPDHPSTGRTLSLIAAPLRELGEYAEAERDLRHSLAILRKAWGEDHVDVLATRGDLAFLRHLQGDRQNAEAEQREVLALKREHLGPEHREVAITLDDLGRQLADQGRLDEAEALLRESLALRRKILRQGHPSIATTEQHLGALLLERGKTEEAERLLRDALAIRRRAYPASHPAIAESSVTLAKLLLQRGSTAEARPLAQEGLAIFEAALPADHPKVAEARAALEACRRGSGGS